MDKTQVTKVWHWGRLISLTSASQTIIQFVGFFSGLIIIRLLPVEEYAFYTIANTVLGAMLILADGGIATGVTSIYGKVYNSKSKSGATISSGLYLRKKFAILSCFLGLPFLIFLLNNQNASWVSIGLLVIAIIPTFYSSLSAKLFEIPLLLKGEVIALQKNRLKVNVSRLFLLLMTIFIFPWAYLALLAGGLPQIWGNLNLKSLTQDHLDWRATPDPEIKEKILVFVKRILPGSVYYCFSGQITLWLISIFGSTETIAQVGALGRLAMILSVIAAIFNTLAIPMFVKLSDDRRNLFLNYTMILTALGICCVGVLIVFMVFPAQALWVLGEGYSGLEYELILYIISSCFELMVGVSFALNSNRGWLINPYLNILVGLTSIGLGLFIFDVASLKGILYFKLLTSIIAFLYFLGYGFLKISKVEESPTSYTT